MELTQSLERVKRVQRSRNIVTTALALSLTANAGLGIFIATQQTKVILVPTITREGVVASGQYDTSYAEVLAVDVVQTLLSVSPESRVHGRAAIQRFAAPQARQQLVARFDEVTAILGDRDVSTVFYVTEISHEPGVMSVRIAGELVTFLGPSRVGEETRTATVRFADAGGVLRVAGVSMEDAL